MIAFGACSNHKTETSDQYLQTVISNLKEIKSATYDSQRESWAPGDTVPSVVSHQYYKAYDNSSDTTLGASWVILDSQDTTQLAFAYDGTMRALVDEDKKTIVIDSFTVRKLPFRPVSVPFYQYTQDFIEYVLNTNDSTSLNYEDMGDTVYIKLTIHEDRQVEFFGKAYYIPENPDGYHDPTSVYELWIDKTTDLPYKQRREMTHNISIETVSNAQFNTMNIEEFVAASYFPADYEIRQYGEKRNVAGPHGLLGKDAPAWKLTNEYGEEIGLNEFESKVVLVQFTSVNCGPCRASVPFLNKLSSTHNKEELNVVAIESFISNTKVLSTYRKRTGLDYQFLMSEEKVNSQYNIQATPIFFILDEGHVIREVFRGYGGASTEEKIIEAINNLL